MEEPEDIRQARALIKRAKVFVDDQVQRIERLRTAGAPTRDAEKRLMQFTSTLSALEAYLQVVRAEAPPQ